MKFCRASLSQVPVPPPVYPPAGQCWALVLSSHSKGLQVLELFVVCRGICAALQLVQHYSAVYCEPSGGKIEIDSNNPIFEWLGAIAAVLQRA